jgi:hypothetical protein
MDATGLIIAEHPIWRSRRRGGVDGRQRLDVGF